MVTRNGLFGAHVLIVEDDYLLAVALASVLEHENASVVGPCALHRTAMEAVTARLPHLALLDVNILGGTSFELAEWLASHQVPFAFITGEPLESIPLGLAPAGYRQKPARSPNVLVLARRMCPRLRASGGNALADAFLMAVSTSSIRGKRLRMNSHCGRK